jgi:hypothetical protein
MLPVVRYYGLAAPLDPVRRYELHDVGNAGLGMIPQEVAMTQNRRRASDGLA